MVNQQLIDYCKSQLKSGYSPQTIRTALQNAGYPSQDIDDALAASGGKHITSSLLFLLILTLLVIAIGIFIALKAAQSPPADLTPAITIFNPEVAPGTELVLSVTITNTVDTQASGTLDVRLSGPLSSLGSTESFSLREQTTVPITIRLPADATPGTYDAEATITYGPLHKTTRAPFTVTTQEEAATPVATETLEETPLLEAERIQQTCPVSCDDLNFCTQDSCQGGVCVNTPITPCCGNRECEPGENEQTCGIDCSETTTPGQLRAQAEQQAPIDINQAIRTCHSLGQQNYVDICLSDISQLGNNKQACKDILETEIRDGCYIQFAFQTDFHACAEITSDAMRYNCEQIIRSNTYAPAG